MGNNKLHGFRKRGTELAYKRYTGQIMKIDRDIIPYSPIECEFSNYSSNFIMAGRPVNKEILIAEKLLEELEKEAVKKDVDLSSLITTYLLEQLERNKPTRIFAKGKTKGKLAYILNNLYECSNFIQYVESEKEFEENIFSNREIEEALTYETTIFDEYIYIENYLKGKGYTKEQIEELQKEEWEEYGTTVNNGVTMVKPYSIELEISLEFNGKVLKELTHNHIVPVFVSARLGFHYVFMKKKNAPKTYEEIEELINKGRYKIWDYYAMFLEKEFNKKNNPQKVE
ncbi:MAG: hypothetical protein [Bacteriophage sp.]|nr:MAG: hypothetical protein [Bacteriophage sp.]